jgi:hypothetical protein
MGGERWLPVAGWETTHHVSDQGRVKRLGRYVTRTRYGKPWSRWEPEIILRPQRVNRVNKKPYLWINLKSQGRVRKVWIHRLVLEAFIGPCPIGMETLHANDIADDNRLENLCWGTHLQNQNQMSRNGHTTKQRKDLARVTEAQVRAIRTAVGNGETQRSVARRLAIGTNTVWCIVHHKTWRYV